MSDPGVPAPQPPTPLVEIRDERLGAVRLLVKRDDLVHSDIVGNKWRKLRHLLADARERRARRLLTFGGAYSNHVRAVAAAGRLHGFETVGVIRGEERPFNDGLARAVGDGMHLHYLDRATYRRKHDPDVIEALQGAFGDFYLIPEGGSTVHAVAGCAELVDEIAEPFDVIACPVGTGGTLAGIVSGLPPGSRALGVSALRGASSLETDVHDLLVRSRGRDPGNWAIDHRFHSGGFARSTPELARFVDAFRARHALRLERVYVAKMMFGVYAAVASGEIVPGATVVAVITGRDDAVAS